MSEPNTSAKTMCFNTLVLEQTPEAFNDAIKLCKNLSYTDQNIDTLILLTEATLKISIPVNAVSVPADPKCNCAYIKEKYYLYNACSVCHSNPEYNKNITQRDYNALIHIINLKKKSSGFFTKSKKKSIMENFKSCIKCSVTQKGATVYLPLARDIYSIIASAIHNTESDGSHKDDIIKKYIKEDDVYKEWCFTHSEYCDANGGNSIAKSIINYIYTSSPKDAGKLADIKDFYVPQKGNVDNVTHDNSKEALPEPAFVLEPVKQETQNAPEPSAPDEMDFSDLYMTPGSLPMPEALDDNVPEPPADEAPEAVPEENQTEGEPPAPNTTENSEDEGYYQENGSTSETVEYEDVSVPADDIQDAASENIETPEEIIPPPDAETQESPEPAQQTAGLENEVDISDIPDIPEPPEEALSTDLMITSVSRDILTNTGYISFDQQKAQALTENIISNGGTVTADIVHFTDQAGVFASLTFNNERYILTDRQFSFLKKLFTNEKFTVITGNISSLYAVLISNDIKPQSRLLQPKGSKREEYLNSLRKGNVSLAGMKDWEMADNVDTDILKAYAYTFRPGTGDEQNLIMTNDLPEIVKKQYIDDEKARLLYLVIMDRNIPRKGWEAIKDDVIASMEYNDVFHKHRARIHYIDNESLTFIFLVPQDKIRSLQTVLAYLVPMILDDLKCSSGIGFKIRKAVRTQTADQSTNTRKEN